MQFSHFSFETGKMLISWYNTALSISLLDQFNTKYDILNYYHASKGDMNWEAGTISSGQMAPIRPQKE